MNFLRWAWTCLMFCILAGCGGGKTTTTLVCTVTGTPLLIYNTSSPVYAGTAVSYNQTAINFISSPCVASYSAINLPSGLSINPASGLITGVVSTAGTATAVVTLTASGSDGSVRSGSTSLAFVTIRPVGWTVKTSNHGVGTLTNQNLVSLGGTLYMVGSQQVGNDFVPLMYQATDGGVIWTNTGTPPPGFLSLRNFRVVADAGALYLIGGRTSNATVMTPANYTYNNAVLKYTPGSPGVWATVAANPFTPIGGSEDLALAWDGAALYAYGGRVGNGVMGKLFRSTNQGATWTLVSESSNSSLYGHCMMSDASGVLYAVGGAGFSPLSNTVTEFTQVLKSSNGGASWVSLSGPLGSLSVPSQAMSSSCAAVDGRLYVLGGVSLAGTNYTGNVLQSLNKGGSWNLDASSPVFGPRALHGMAVLNGSLMVLGGANSLGARTDVIQGTP